MTEPPTSDGAKNRTASRHRNWSSTDHPAYPVKAAPSSSKRCISASQVKKAKLLYSLHAGPVAFVVANLFNAGSARIVAGLGFENAATSSSGFAATLGRKDGRITHAEALSDARAVLEPTDLPRHRPVLRTVSAILRRLLQKPCAGRLKPASSVSRSKARPKTKINRSISSIQHSKGFKPVLRQRDLSALISNLRDSAIIFCAGNRIATIRFGTWRPMRKPVQRY